MNMRRADEEDEGDDLAAALAALVPLEPQRDVKSALLAEFDASVRQSRDERRRRVGREIAMVIAAAAVLLLAVVLLFHRRGATEPRDGFADAAFVLLQARLDRIADSLARVQGTSVAESIGPAGKRLDPLLDATGRDAGLLRLVAASRLELSDKPAAAERYRALIRDYRTSPASKVASERLEQIEQTR